MPKPAEKYGNRPYCRDTDASSAITPGHPFTWPHETIAATKIRAAERDKTHPRHFKARARGLLTVLPNGEQKSTAELRRDLPLRSESLICSSQTTGGAPRAATSLGSHSEREGGLAPRQACLRPRCRLGNKANGQKRLRQRKRPPARGGAEAEAVPAGGAGTPGAAVPRPRPRGPPRPQAPPRLQAPPLDRGRRRRGGCGGAAAESLKERSCLERARHCPAPPRPSPPLPPPPRGGPSRRVDVQRLAGTAGAGTHGRHGLLQLRRAGERPAPRAPLCPSAAARGPPRPRPRSPRPRCVFFPRGSSCPGSALAPGPASLRARLLPPPFLVCGAVLGSPHPPATFPRRVPPVV